jgi:hypothetical protein
MELLNKLLSIDCFKIAYSGTSYSSAIWQLWPVSVARLQIYTYAYHLWLLKVRFLLCVTPAVTQDLGLCCFIQRTGLFKSLSCLLIFLYIIKHPVPNFFHTYGDVTIAS